MAWQAYQKVKQTFVFWLARKLPTCKDVTQMVSVSMEERLPLRQRIDLKLHLWICLACTRYRKQLQWIRETIRRHESELQQSTEPTLSHQARERIKRSLL